MELNLELLATYSLATIILTIIAVKFFIVLAHKYNLKSVPHKGGVRQDRVPTSGGISFGFVYLTMILTFKYFHGISDPYFLSIFFGSGMLMLIGFIDDIFSNSNSILSRLTRLFTQFAFVTFTMWLFEAENYSFGNPILMIPIYLLGLTWVINTFNFVDGADGLVSVNSAFFSFMGGTFCFLNLDYSLAACLWMLTSINIGFLVFNWSPAKVFMGDSGALMIGSIYSIFILGALSNGISSVWTWLILLSIFYVDTTVTLLVRLIRRDKAFTTTHSLHAYQQLIIKTGKHDLPALFSIFINLVWTIPMSVLSYFYPSNGFYITVIACLPLIFLFYLKGPYLEKN